MDGGAGGAGVGENTEGFEGVVGYTWFMDLGSYLAVVLLLMYPALPNSSDKYDK